MRWVFLFWTLCWCCAAAVAGEEVITGYKGEADQPQTPGYHKMVYHYSEAGKPYTLSFLLYLPKSYVGPATQPSTQTSTLPSLTLSARPATQPATGPTTRSTGPYPLLTYLSGLGERGSNPQMMLASGVPHDINQRPEVVKWFPMIMIAPQCPADSRYEDDRIGKAITSLIDEISQRYPVDPQRRYLTGFSMGGTGCWSVARFARDRLAVVAPIVPRVFQPKVLSEALAGTDVTCLIISGEVDPKSEPGSAEMAKALRARGVDVVYAKVPKGDHNLWSWYFHERSFYEWLLSHRRGQPKPADRMGEAAVIEMARERADQNGKYLAALSADLQKVAPWWQIDNCRVSDEQGLQKEVNGRHDIFETRQYYPEAPCRLQTTQTLPQAPRVVLHLVVGRHKDGDWKLIVRVNEEDTLTMPIDKQTTPDLWKEIDVDLTAYAGKEVRLQVCQAELKLFRRGQAYWETIKIVSGPALAPATRPATGPATVTTLK